MRGSRNFRQGCPGQSDKKKALTTFFFSFFCPQLILQKSNGQFQRNLSFLKVPEGVQLFPGVVQLFSRGVQLLVPYRNPYNLWFSRGGPDPLPPLDPHLLCISSLQCYSVLSTIAQALRIMSLKILVSWFLMPHLSQTFESYQRVKV